MRKILQITTAVLILVYITNNSKESVMKKIEVGDAVPSFTLLDHDGQAFTVDNTLDKPLVIYFYPKDDTPGCTREACRFRDDFERFTDLGTLVIGISADSVESHKKFREKYQLPYTLLADTDNEVRQLFGVPKSMLFLPGRVTYVVDRKGIVRYVFNSQFNATQHVEEALKVLNEL